MDKFLDWTWGWTWDNNWGDMVKYYECHLKGLKLKLCQQTDSQIPDGDFQGHQHCPNSFWHYANTRTIHLPSKLTISRFIDLKTWDHGPIASLPSLYRETLVFPGDPFISGSRTIITTLSETWPCKSKDHFYSMRTGNFIRPRISSIVRFLQFILNRVLTGINRLFYNHNDLPV